MSTNKKERFALAKSSDAQLISAMIIESIDYFHSANFSRKEMEIWRRGYEPKTLARLIEERKSLVLWIDDEVAGFMQYDEPEIKSVYVSPKYMGKGLGRKLIVQMLKLLKSEGIRTAELTCTEFVVDFYLKLGFENNGPVTTYWEGHAFNEYHMTISLAS